MTPAVRTPARTSAELVAPLAHWRTGTVQDVPPAGLTDLGPGYPDPQLLPVALLRGAYARALDEYGPAALAYGHNAGALPLREALAGRAQRADGRPCDPGQLLVTAGTSQALHLLSGLLCGPGGTVLTDQYTYDLARRIFTDCGLRVRPVAMDGHGMVPAELAGALRAERVAGRRVGFCYLIPTFHNPTGLVVPVERRLELLAVSREHGLTVVEDGAYAELGLTPGHPVPPSLAALAGYRGVVHLGSFAKTLGPGLRLGWLAGEQNLVLRLADHGLLVSGGSLNHTTSLAVATLLRDGDYDRHLERLRTGLRERRDALAGPLRALPADRFSLHVPDGGFFLWARTSGSPQDATARAAAAGVRLSPGSRFGTGRSTRLRLSYAFNPPGLLASAAHRLAEAWSADPPPGARPAPPAPVAEGNP